MITHRWWVQYVLTIPQFVVNPNFGVEGPPRRLNDVLDVRTLEKKLHL